MLNSESLQRWIILNHSCVQALEALQELDPGTWLKGFVVAKRPFGYLISVAPPETEGRGAGARAIGLAYRKEVEGAPDVGSEVTWAPHLASIWMGITLKVAWTDDASLCCWPCDQDKSWEFTKICSIITLSYKVHFALSHCCNMNERNLSRLMSWYFKKQRWRWRSWIWIFKSRSFPCPWRLGSWCDFERWNTLK